MFCNRCNTEFSEGLRYCKWCGQPLTSSPHSTGELHKCPTCGDSIRTSWIFCKTCGSRLQEPHTGEERPTVECRWCNASVDATLQRCDVCGAALRADAPIPEGATLCPHCGDIAEQGTVYCKACGRPIARPSSESGETVGIASITGISGPIPAAESSVESDSQTTESLKIEPGFFATQRAEANKGGPNDDAMTGHGLETNAMNAVTEVQPERRSPTGVFNRSRATGVMDVPHFEPLPTAGEPAPLHPQNVTQGQTNFDDGQVRVDGVSAQDTQTQSSDSTITLIIEPPASSLNPGASGLEPAPEWMSFQFSDVSPSGEDPSSVRQTAGWNESFLQPDEQPFVTGYETVAMQAQTEPIAEHPRSSEPPPTGEFVAPTIPPHLANPELEKWDSKVRSFAETHVPESPTPAPMVPAQPQPHVSPPPPAHAYRPRPDRGPAPPQMMHAPAPARRGGMGLIVLGVILVVLLVGALLVWRFALSDAISRRPEKPTVTESEAGSEAPAPPTNPPITSEASAPEGMVYVEAGIYEVGSDSGDLYAQPRHSITLAPFYIDRTEVTNSEYKRFVDERLHPAPDGWIDGHYPPGTDNVPVVNVTWQDATDFARWSGKRLPTETEWEAAARGKDQRIYPWGNVPRDSVANIGSQGVIEVGRYKAGASPCGALDMIGNVWEWTSDEFHLYPGNKNPMPILKAGITYRVFRGGAYDSQTVDASYRGFQDADKGYPKVGFRCVKNADQ